MSIPKDYILVREQVGGQPRSEMVFLIYEDSGGKYGSLIQYCGVERKPTPEFYCTLKSPITESESIELVQFDRFYNIDLLRKLWVSMTSHQGFGGKKYEVSKE